MVVRGSRPGPDRRTGRRARARIEGGSTPMEISSQALPESMRTRRCSSGRDPNRRTSPGSKVKSSKRRTTRTTSSGRRPAKRDTFASVCSRVSRSMAAPPLPQHTRKGGWAVVLCEPVRTAVEGAPGSARRLATDRPAKEGSCSGRRERSLWAIADAGAHFKEAPRPGGEAALKEDTRRTEAKRRPAFRRGQGSRPAKSALLITSASTSSVAAVSVRVRE